MKKFMRVLAWMLIISGISIGVSLAKFAYLLTIGEFLTSFCASLLLICGGGLLAIIFLSKHDL